MERIPEISHHIRLPVNIEVFPELRDHIFEKTAVFPAVESMQLLAKVASEFQPDLEVRCFVQAGFGKFLVIDSRDEVIKALVALKKDRNGGISASLLSTLHFTGSGITRMMEHARLIFSPRIDASEVLSMPDFEVSKTEFTVSSEMVYRELVPFGPAYQNIFDNVRLNPAAATGRILAPERSSLVGPLGSPFVLDAAFHAACVWGQRYTGFIGFPVGFYKRIVVKPTVPGGIYTAYMVPVKRGQGENVFNLWIFASDGGVFEVVKGLQMRDVTGGRTKPPEWIRKNN